MSDGTEEETVEKSTDELLSETEDILGGVDASDPPASDTGSGGDELDGTAASTNDDGATTLDDSTFDLGGTDTANEPATDANTETAAATDDRRFRKYFDPSSAGISGVLVLAGALLGGLVPIPFVGALTRLLGVGAATFLHGVTASDSRYAETAVASGVVGLGLGALTNPLLTFTSAGVPVLAISTAATMLVALVGHYFGRDLRNGLTQDVGGGNGSGGDDDVPGW